MSNTVGTFHTGALCGSRMGLPTHFTFSVQPQCLCGEPCSKTKVCCVSFTSLRKTTRNGAVPRAMRQISYPAFPCPQRYFRPQQERLVVARHVRLSSRIRTHHVPRAIDCNWRIFDDSAEWITLLDASGLKLPSSFPIRTQASVGAHHALTEFLVVSSGAAVPGSGQR